MERLERNHNATAEELEFAEQRIAEAALRVLHDPRGSKRAMRAAGLAMSQRRERDDDQGRISTE